MSIEQHNLDSGTGELASKPGRKDTASGDGRRREGRGRGGGGERRPRRERDAGRPEQEFFERVVDIRRVSKVVKGGRNLTFTALVVVGNGKGKVGSAIGRGSSVPDAVRRGASQARRDANMLQVLRVGTSIPHEITVKYSGARVFLKPARTGTGIIAGGGVRATMEAAGITDIVSKSLGSSNPINVVRATLKGLSMMRDPKRERARRTVGSLKNNKPSPLNPESAPTAALVQQPSASDEHNSHVAKQTDTSNEGGA